MEYALSFCECKFDLQITSIYTDILTVGCSLPSHTF